MEFYKNLYWCESLEHKKEKIQRKLEKGKPLLHVYLLVLPQTKTNQLEFFDSILLQQKWFYRQRTFRVVGIADSYETAMELVVRITEEAAVQTGGGCIRQYLEENWG